ncbi:hypothetical protein RhiLY_03512 [Ceratobasidium sp. AG-Ba]|nr:hypothetical protein RhiLY_03512 [Ceratobasidium sp. AG-Ba]
MAPEVRHLFADSPLPVYPRYNNRDHYPVKHQNLLKMTLILRSDGQLLLHQVWSLPIDMVLMKGWGGRTEHPLAPPKSPSVLSYEYIERQEELTQDQGQESSHDSVKKKTSQK